MKPRNSQYPVSRYATTVYNRRRRIESKLQDIYSRAIAYRFTADHLLDELAAVWLSADFKRLPAYDRGYIRGLEQGLNRDIWQNHVVWRLGPASGPTRTAIKDEWSADMSELCRKPGELYGGHFWTDDSGQPTDKIWTEYKATN